MTEGKTWNIQPHLHPACSIIAAEILEPTNALIKNGRVLSDSISPRHLSVVMSAITTCVSNCNPLQEVFYKNGLEGESY
jgi:hypothetical protein